MNSSCMFTLGWKSRKVKAFGRFNLHRGAPKEGSLAHIIISLSVHLIVTTKIPSMVLS